jgi:Dyp-type peroxidase family
MAVVLDYADIQGNILSPYGKLGFPKARFITLHVEETAKARNFVTALLPMITTALRWKSGRSDAPTGYEVPRPQVAVNIAFSWNGLLQLGVPTRTLRGMPDEFIDGMMARAPMLGDDFNGTDLKTSWDEVWTSSTGPRSADPNTVHILIMLNAQMKPDGTPVEALDAVTDRITAVCSSTGGVRILAGHNQPGRPKVAHQELSALTERLPDGSVSALPTEHFGFTDAIGDPVFEGQYPGRYEEQVAVGSGAMDGTGRWRPLATGEFLLGFPDEAQEIAGAAMPLDFSRNGTFMAYRKLHQNVVAFKTFMTEAAARFGSAFGISDPADALAALKAKMVGRWPDGVPLSVAPTVADWHRFNADHKQDSLPARLKAISEFAYGDDPDGITCPMTSHMRRVNPRDGMGPMHGQGSVLTNRRRILRRGLPYGNSSNGASDDDEHGIVMLIVCASLFRQFEFVQQQWINYGLDARAGNDTCPLVGTHSPGGDVGPKAKFVVPADPSSGRPPFILEGLPRFVETRGGEYFFVPSMTALRMIGMGVVDPT